MPHWLPARCVQDPRRSLRGHLPVVPAGTPPARAEALRTTESCTLCPDWGPFENRAIAPDGVQNDGELARDRNGGALPADALGKSQRPSLQRRWSLHASHQYAGSLVQVAAQQRVVGLADTADPLAVAGLVLAGREAEVRADLAGR